MRIGVISDTHIPARSRILPAAVFEVFDGVDAILHAGDALERGVLTELGAIAPVHAVLGNCDDWSLQGILPRRARLDFGGLSLGMIHDSGSTDGRRRRMAAAFPGCRVVVFGHSHQPVVDDDGELLLLNPGSAVDPRRAKIPTVAVLEIAGGRPTATLVELPVPARPGAPTGEAGGAGGSGGTAGRGEP